MLTTTVCAALSAAGLAIAFLTAYRRRFAAATRLAAFALLPIGLAMAGLVGLAGKIGSAVGGWAADLVLKPSVWAGFGVLALAVVLYVIARVTGRGAGEDRRPSRRERRAAARAERKGVTAATAPQAAAPAAGGPAAGSASAARRPGGAGPATGAKGGLTGAKEDDFSDIEAILKKHGI